jgi:hypothetical protein
MKLVEKLYRKIVGTENIKCNCKRLKDQDIESAVSMKESEAFIFYLDKKKIKYLQCGTFDTDFFIKIKGNDVKVLVGYRIFYKNSCLACGTCLGWETKGHSEKISLDEYFDSVIDNEINKIERKQKAKEICSEI